MIDGVVISRLQVHSCSQRRYVRRGAADLENEPQVARTAVGEYHCSILLRRPKQSLACSCVSSVKVQEQRVFACARIGW